MRQEDGSGFSVDVAARMQTMTMSVRSFAALLCATGALGGFCAHAEAANSTPKISGTPPTWVAINGKYNFEPASSDANGDRLTFSVANKPGWAYFNTTTGALYGWPGKAAGSYNNIVITVSDGKARTSLPAFSFTVSNSPPKSTANRAPVISGTPTASVNVGTAYSFRPNASDPDGNGIAFSVSNKPQWLSFNTTTGALSGTPLAANAGSYSNIAITVTDGKASAALTPFAVTVRAASSPPPATTGAATISWLPPTRNTDGSSLSNLAGYRIVYGTNSSALNQTVQLTNPSLSTYMIENLPRGTHYFALRAYTSGGAESGISQVVSKVIK